MPTAFRMSAYGAQSRAHLFNVGCSICAVCSGTTCRGNWFVLGINSRVWRMNHIPRAHCMLCVEIAQRLFAGRVNSQLHPARMSRQVLSLEIKRLFRSPFTYFITAIANALALNCPIGLAKPFAPIKLRQVAHAERTVERVEKT